VAVDLYAQVMAALRAAHPTRVIGDTDSEYFLAAEIATATAMTGLSIAVPGCGWSSFEYDLRPFPWERE
jgi:hypothetical protein